MLDGYKKTGVLGEDERRALQCLKSGTPFSTT